MGPWPSSPRWAWCGTGRSAPTTSPTRWSTWRSGSRTPGRAPTACELLGEAENLQNVIAIEDRLTQRETEIESLTGQLEVLGDRAALATIEVAFVERDDPAVSDDLPGPLEALRAGVVALANVTLVLAAAVAFALPFAPFAALGWYLARRVRRGRARRRLPPPPG